MKTYKCNIWNYADHVDAICFTSNGYVKPNGCAVMGRGIALDTKNKFPGIDKLLGNHIEKNGNNVGVIQTIPNTRTVLVNFPVKRTDWVVDYDTGAGDDDWPGFARPDLMEKFRGHAVYPGWALRAEYKIIQRSAEQLMSLIEWKEWSAVLITKPGCYNGGLNWKSVELMLEKIFDHRVFVVSND